MTRAIGWRLSFFGTDDSCRTEGLRKRNIERKVAAKPNTQATKLAAGQTPATEAKKKSKKKLTKVTPTISLDMHTTMTTSKY